MRILLTGATGTIGRKLLPALLDAGHEVIALTRNPKAFKNKPITCIVGDLTSRITFPKDIDVAYYLVHSMTKKVKDYVLLEKLTAKNFVSALKDTNTKQIIFLGGIANESDPTEHIVSRQNTENILKESKIPTTILRSSIIVDKQSASFQIIMDLVHRLPIMIAPKLICKLCQPIAMKDVIFYLTSVIMHPDCLNQTFDIGGPDILSYKELMQRYAKIIGKKRVIFTVSILTPYLASLWLVLISHVNFTMCKRLAENMRNNFICNGKQIQSIFPRKCLSYDEAIKDALGVQSESTLAPAHV